MKLRNWWLTQLLSLIQLWLTQLVFAAGAWAGPPVVSRKMTCQLLEGDRILAADLAAVSPAFGALNPAVEIGLAPLPGIRRVLHSGALLQLARDYGIEFTEAPAEVCFERPGGASARTAREVPPAPPAVKRGDKVAVSVTTGSVLLTFDSEAESAGRVGDTVIVRNPGSGNRFVARVQDRGKVVVEK
jgi:hypothetical protein